MAAAKHREEIIRAASRLLRKRGYAATGLNDILAESGAPKGSLYHYFPEGKEQLAEEAIRQSGAVVTATLEHLRARHGGKAAAVLVEYGRLLAGWMADSGFRDGCPLATTILETVPDSPRLTQAARAALADWARVFADMLAAEGWPPDRAGSLGGVAIAAIEGSLIQCRVSGDPRPIVDAAAAVAALMAAGP
ncbi:TetR/AcrR family transcriptional regulator [Zavarzinia compransoris]|uniref:TetR/AcrR family transcriptional regulator n=1 Tax=Zavarzinia compransoris TaxID=1264899 RepID=A0A317E5L0_9PROT|nr:TetR/AcrR family transcriptional regulator [Zavarzinia compransoris]PWR22309.1 TetR/AcrR family transcriptional regulator [Zavarzinia compransoris]TDP46927.1 TetR family transcriptional regulator [Zavarzinia compransoris]